MREARPDVRVSNDLGPAVRPATGGAALHDHHIPGAHSEQPGGTRPDEKMRRLEVFTIRGTPEAGHAFLLRGREHAPVGPVGVGQHESGWAGNCQYNR